MGANPHYRPCLFPYFTDGITLADDHGSFHRSFQIPEEIEEDQIKGEYKNGVLELTLPMKEPEKRKVKKNKN